MNNIDFYIKNWRKLILKESYQYSEVNFKRFNFNKWKQNIGDCAIRAICAGIGMDYELVCKRLGVSFKRGKGLIRDTGIKLDDIKEKFDEYFDVVQDYNEVYDFKDDISKDKYIDLDMWDNDEDDQFSSGDTLEDFLLMYNDGEYLIGLTGNKKAESDKCKKGGHIVYANTLNEPYFIDTWDCSEMLVDCFMRINKKVPKDSNEHWKYDKEKKMFI